MLVKPETDRDRETSFIASISFLGELSCVDGIQSCLVNEYQDKCRGLHEQAAINAPRSMFIRLVFEF